VTATPSGSRRVDITTVAAGEWLRLERIEYLDRARTKRTWETVARQREQGAVIMVARLLPSCRYILVEQYRPPVDRIVLEFPAGLVDPGEPPHETAVRELREETGFRGSVRWMGPLSYSSAGMSGEAVQLALMDVDETELCNQNPQPDLDDGEDIHVYLVLECNVASFLAQRQQHGAVLDAKTAAFFLGAGLLRQ